MSTNSQASIVSAEHSSPSTATSRARLRPPNRGPAATYGALPNELVLRGVPATAECVLDVGCGAGANARRLAERGHRVIGIAGTSDEAAQVAQWCEEVLVHDLERGLPDDLPRPAAVVCSHVLEHLREPGALLDDIRRLLQADGRLVVAVPNVMQWRYRLRLMAGRFEYEAGGVMDRDHVRWYTLRSTARLLEEVGFEVLACWGEGGVPMGAVRRWVPSRLQRLLDEGATAAWPALFGTQIVYVARLRGVGPACG